MQVLSVDRWPADQSFARPAQSSQDRLIPWAVLGALKYYQMFCVIQLKNNVFPENCLFYFIAAVLDHMFMNSM